MLLGATIIKDIQLLARDRSALASLFLLPVIFMGVFGAIFYGEGQIGPKGWDLAIYHHPDDPRGSGIATALASTGLFRTDIMESADAVAARVADERYRVGLVIPHDFDPRSGRPALLYIDPASDPAVRGPIEAALERILTTAYQTELGHELVSVLQSRAPPGMASPERQPTGFQVSVPGNAVLFGFFLALTVALSFVEERKSGTFTRILAAPIARWPALVAKLVPFVLIGMIQFAFLFGIGVFGFGMRVAGSAAALVLLNLVVVVCATGLGLFIASFGGSEKQVGGLGSLIILVMGLLGGAMVPHEIMPDTMRTIGLLVPHAWALDGYHDVLIRDGVGVTDIWRQVAAVAGFAVLFTGIGAWRFRFEPR